MNLLSMITGALQQKRGDTVHDFTYLFAGHTITKVKQLSDLRVFLTGNSSEVSRGDIVIIRSKGNPPSNLRYRVESVRYVSPNSWQAYASLEQRPWNKVRFQPRG